MATWWPTFHPGQSHRLTSWAHYPKIRSKVWLTLRSCPAGVQDTWYAPLAQVFSHCIFNNLVKVSLPREASSSYGQGKFTQILLLVPGSIPGRNSILSPPSSSSVFPLVVLSCLPLDVWMSSMSVPCTLLNARGVWPSSPKTMQTTCRN